MLSVNVNVSEKMMKGLEKSVKDLMINCIEECGKRYGFDSKEEIRLQGLDVVVVSVSSKKEVKVKEVSSSSSSKVLKKEVSSSSKEKWLKPFISSCVSEDGCKGLEYNRGLFTQCKKSRMENGKYCNGCQKEADKSTTGCPDSGTVEERMSCGLYEFKDPKGRKAVRYTKVLEKLKISKESVLSEASKENIEIPTEHLESEKKSSGRPKKKSDVIAVNDVSDLFEKLTVEGEVGVVEDKKNKKLSDEDKAAKKAALEADREAKKLAREAKLVQDKLDREEKRKADMEQKKLDREAKMAQEKADREAKIAQEKADREAKRAEKKSAKGSKSNKSETEKVKTPVMPEDEVKVEAEVPAKVTVSRIQIAGKQYLKSSNNILYDPNTKEEVGLWDPESKTIKELPDDEEEEVDDDEVEEEDYE